MGLYKGIPKVLKCIIVIGSNPAITPIIIFVELFFEYLSIKNNVK